MAPESKYTQDYFDDKERGIKDSLYGNTWISIADAGIHEAQAIEIVRSMTDKSGPIPADE
jgi:hypothetical protein